jgi:hypothetical protein
METNNTPALTVAEARLENTVKEFAYGMSSADWIITSAKRGTASRFQVEGINLSANGQTFSWGVEDMSSDRFALHESASDETVAVFAEAKAARAPWRR